MDVRLAAAVTAGKAAGLATRGLRRGGGTALPGLVAARLAPDIVHRLGRQLGRGRVLITGTNGKTTTTRILAGALEQARVPYINNREGSNLMRGIATTLLAAANPSGTIPRASTTLGLFETDEATLPLAARALAPTVITFTNLFRDQLDRYGEVDTVAAFWREALAASPKDATLVLNADDPSVAELSLDWPGPVHWFGLDDAAQASEAGGAFDARWCRVCGGTFAYSRRYFAHVGYWRCTGCGRERQHPATSGTNLVLGLDAASFDVEGLGHVTMPLTGLYNVYNALAAIATARVLELEGSPILAGLAHVKAAFGRQEVVEFEGRKLRIMLCKNPAGANQVLRLLAGLPAETPLNVAPLLNDRFADGQDVSWIWDVDYELLAGRVDACWAAGDRAEDMALRLKYAHWPQPQLVSHDPAVLLDAIVRGTPSGADVFVIPTYTAMLDLRGELVRRGAIQPFWER
ncbi:MAG: MurT ligase domain-containing protein [Tepidiformaceae bacterium]